MTRRFRVTFSFEVSVESETADALASAGTSAAGRRYQTHADEAIQTQNRLLSLVLEDEAFVTAWIKRILIDDLAYLSKESLSQILQVEPDNRRIYRQLQPFIKKLSRKEQEFFHVAASDSVFEERISYFLHRFSSELVAGKLVEVEEE